MTPPSLAETAGLFGKGFAVFIGRKEILSEFGDTREDVLKSFWCAAILFPLFLWLVYGFSSDKYDDAPALTRFLAHFTYYTIAWLYWPVVMASVSEIMGYPRNWARYVVVVNWTFSIPFLLIFVALNILGPSSEAILSGLWLGIQAWSFLIHGWIIQKFFKTSLALTIALLVSEFLLGQIAQEFENRIILRSMI